MKKRSILVSFAVAIIVGFVAFDYGLNRAYWMKIYNETFAQKADNLPSEAFVMKTLLLTYKDMQVLQDALENRRERLHSIDFWAIFHSGKVYKSGINNVLPETFEFDFSAEKQEHLIMQDHYFYVVTDLDDGFKLVAGLRNDPQHFLDVIMAERLNVYVGYLVGIVFIALAIFTYLFRDFIRSLRVLTQWRGRKFGEIKASSREAEVLLRGFAAYESNAAKLASERDLYGWQVLPSLRTELSSGKKPPYDFNCTLVRTDINNFTKIFNDHPIEPFAETINEFFTEASHIVARYGGLMHEFIGDEVIYYFKDESVGNSVAAALSAIRDVNEAASRLHARCLKERGYPFTVKSSLAHGRIRFGRFVNGYNLAGGVLIETVRILSQIAEKDGNVVVFDERHLGNAGSIADAETYARVSLKGFSREMNLYVYREHRRIEDFLENQEISGNLVFYRSDRDLATIVAWCRERARTGDYKSSSRVLGLLRGFSLSRSDGTPRAEVLAWMKELFGETPKAWPEAKLRIAATLLKVVENLVPREDFGEEFEGLLQKAMTFGDRRVTANALDVMTYFKATTEPEFASRLAKHDDNRVAANALVHEGLKGFSPFILRRLRKMLDAKSVSHVASSLYAIGELARHHRTQDPVYYETQIDFLALIDLLPRYAAHADAMVRRQAMIAARKSDDARVIEAARTAAGGEYALEATEHLGAAALLKRAG